MSELTKNVQPLQDFNWDEFENGTVANISKEELDKAYDETLNKVADHQVVEGKVISVDKKEVVVNIGYKSDGIIPAGEFRYNPDLKEGDVVEVYVETAEDKKGQLVLSHKKARLSQAWDRVNEALEAQDAYKGVMMRTYETAEEVTLLKGGVLRRNVSKRIGVKAYLINEDFLVRSGEALD